MSTSFSPFSTPPVQSPRNHTHMSSREYTGKGELPQSKRDLSAMRLYSEIRDGYKYSIQYKVNGEESGMTFVLDQRLPGRVSGGRIRKV
jgi:hypothetical protein